MEFLPDGGQEGGIKLLNGLAPGVGFDLRPRETISLEAVSPHYARKLRDKVGSRALCTRPKPNASSQHMLFGITNSNSWRWVSAASRGMTLRAAPRPQSTSNEEMPEYLYHYCSNASLLDILASHKVRLSDLSLSNDSLEGRWVRKVFQRIRDTGGGEPTWIVDAEVSRSTASFR